MCILCPDVQYSVAYCFKSVCLSVNLHSFHAWYAYFPGSGTFRIPFDLDPVTHMTPIGHSISHKHPAAVRYIVYSGIVSL